MSNYSRIAAEICKEQNMAKNWKYIAAEKKKYMFDEYATKYFFEKICYRMGMIDSKNADTMIEKMKSVDCTAKKKNGTGPWQFSYEAMYRILRENEICNRICEKQGYKNWQDIIYKYAD